MARGVAPAPAVRISFYPPPVVGLDCREPLEAIARGGVDEGVLGAEVRSVLGHFGTE